MKRTMMLMALAAFSAPGWGATWEAALQPSLYSVTFADYIEGERLSNKGATGASWKTIPSISMTRAVYIGDRPGLAMEYATKTDITIETSQTMLASAKAFRSAVWLTAYETTFENLPELNKGTDKFAFSMWTPPGGKPTFIGWTADGWKKLYLKSGERPEPKKWYDLSVWLGMGVGGKLRVQYRIKVGDDYEPLLAEDNSSWLEAGAGNSQNPKIGSVAFRGEGAFDALASKDLPTSGLTVHFR